MHAIAELRSCVAFVRKPNSAALAFIVISAIWFVIGTFYGLLSAIHFIAPEFFNNIPALVFSRVRPIHVNTVFYGFVAGALIGSGLYYTPALLKRTLWSEPLGWVSCLFWNLTVLSGPVTFSLGYSQGREYCEYLWIFDVSLVLAVVLLAFNLIMTMAHRREQRLYVSVWYYIASFLWLSGSYFLGNVMWKVPSGALSGIVDSLFLWFLAHILPGLLLTPLAIGAAYYVIPRVTKTPLYSHTLSVLGFWTLVTFYSHIGGHHLLQAPVPTWLKTVTVVDSVLMLIPVLIAVMNLWMTWRGRFRNVLYDISAQWVLLGILWYLFVGIQGSFQSLPQIQRVTHFNNWTIGHAHLAVLGFSGFIAIGTIWHVLPLITGRRLYSEKIVRFIFGSITFGLSGFFVALTIAGLIQGQAWNNGETVYRVLPELQPYFILRAGFGLFIVISAVLTLFVIMMTIFKGQRLETEPPP